MLAATSSYRRAVQGFTLVELLIIIVVLGIAGATLTMVSARSAQLSASMLREQQAFALANAMLDEIVAMPFTACDPSPSSCAAPENAAPGPEAGEARNGANGFDNVNDYHGLNVAVGTLRDVFNNPIAAELPTVANCVLRVTVVPQVLPGVPAVPANDALRITVTVTCPAQMGPVAAEAIRVRYAPDRWQF
ncbi:MAG: type II secretion system protein [Aquabacterium sp.]|mgnify:CR=1 FL=1|jgi:type II secretory pathway pseudopilin PulG|nr:type II secretion system protein [Aquabacterium sp.]